MNSSPISDETAADWNVELNTDTLDRADELLHDFATDAELEMALIADVSGAMIAGVATRQDVDVATVGALVAGAFGALRALAKELGESSLTESMHHGSGDTVYLRDIGGRFILLGVAEVSLPAGIVREKAARVGSALAELLTDDGNGETVAEEAAIKSVADSPFQVDDEYAVSDEPVQQGTLADQYGPDESTAETSDTAAVPMADLDPAVRTGTKSRIGEKADESISGGEAEVSETKGPQYVFEIG